MLAVEQLTQGERAMLRCALKLCIHHWGDGLAVLIDTGDLNKVDRYLNSQADFRNTATAMLKHLVENDVPEF